MHDGLFFWSSGTRLTKSLWTRHPSHSSTREFGLGCVILQNIICAINDLRTASRPTSAQRQDEPTGDCTTPRLILTHDPGFIAAWKV